MVSWLGRFKKAVVNPVVVGSMLVIFCSTGTYASSYLWPVGEFWHQEVLVGTHGEFRPSVGGSNPCYNKDYLHDGADVRSRTAGDRKVYSVETEKVLDVGASYILTNYHDYRHMENIQVVKNQNINADEWIGDHIGGSINYLHLSDEEYRDWHPNLDEDCDVNDNVVPHLLPYDDDDVPWISEDIRFIADENPNIWYQGSTPTVEGRVDIVVNADDEVYPPGGEDLGIYKTEWWVVGHTSPLKNIEFGHTVDDWRAELVYVRLWSSVGTYWYNVTNTPQESQFWETDDPVNFPDGYYTVCVKVYDWNPFGGNTAEQCKTVYVENGNTGNEEDVSGIDAYANRYALLQNQPNPFGKTTNIRFSVPEAKEEGSQESDPKHVTLQIYDLAGQLVRTLVNGNRTAGWYSVSWDGRNHQGNNVQSGTYFSCLDTEGFSQVRKMTLVR